MVGSDIKKYCDDGVSNGAHPDVSYGFFTRVGGVSNGVYAGLNCGLGSQDVQENVHKNREIVAQHFNLDNSALLSPYQVHGNVVQYVDKIWDERPRADAVLTDKRNIALSVVTADCAPVLFYGCKKEGDPVIAAAHAGWRGALSGVLDNTVTAMIQQGAVHDTISACVGPCIARDSYEVQNAFVEPFIDHDPESERFFCGSVSSTHCFFDLAAYCAWRLSLAGIKRVSILDCDTYKNETEFYSYRRTTHRGEHDYGRQISAISIT